METGGAIHSTANGTLVGMWWKTQWLEECIPWTKSTAVLNHLVPPDTPYLIFSRNPNIISFCTDAEITLLFHIHLSPGLHLLHSKAWVPSTKHISFLFLPYWAWDKVIYLWLMHRTIQPTAGRQHLHCMKRVILWCLGIAQVWSSYHGLTRCSACTELWKVFMYALSPQQIWGKVTWLNPPWKKVPSLHLPRTRNISTDSYYHPLACCNLLRGWNVISPTRSDSPGFLRIDVISEGRALGM